MFASPFGVRSVRADAPHQDGDASPAAKAPRRKRCVSQSLAVTLLLAGAGAIAATAGGLDGYLWRKRVVVVFAPAADDPRLARQRAEMGPLIGARDDRDLVFVVIAGQRAEPARIDGAALRRRFRVARGSFRALLIGKDGGVKLDGPGVIDAASLASVIDAMPMRRQELKP